MSYFIIDDLQQGYTDIGQYLLKAGGEAPVGRAGASDTKTLELLGVAITLTHPERALPIGVGRELNPRIAAAEALQLIGGWSDPALLTRITPNMAGFMDAGVFHGAYGPRLRTQLPDMLQRLRDDPTSRQAVTTIWDPQHDSVDGPRDLPCTITLQWIIRGHRLHAFTYMRSNDFWWGLAYDAFQFTQLQITLATLLGVGLGHYHHHVGSFHAYQRDWEKIASLRSPDARAAEVPRGLADTRMRSWREVQEVTHQLREKKLYLPTIGQRWYAQTLADVL